MGTRWRLRDVCDWMDRGQVDEWTDGRGLGGRVIRPIGEGGQREGRIRQSVNLGTGLVMSRRRGRSLI